MTAHEGLPEDAVQRFDVGSKGYEMHLKEYGHYIPYSSYATLRSHCSALEARCGELEGALEGLYRRENDRQRESKRRDHACSECLVDYPPSGRDLVIEGFRCYYHAARALLSSNSRKEGEG